MSQQGSESNDCTDLKGVLHLLGDRWSVLILWAVKDTPKRFVDIQKLIDINSRTLTQRLELLEEAGMLIRQEYKEYPPRTEYAATPKGQAIQPILDEMMHWSHVYGNKS